MHELAAAAAERARSIGQQLVEPPEAPMSRLARRLGLEREHVELLWTVVACSIDGRLLPHLESLGGGHARRGLSLSVYAMLAELGDDTAADLAHWLASPNPLIADGLVTATENVSPAARAYAASARLVSFLRDEDHAIAPLRIAAAPKILLHDEDQRATIVEIAAAMRRSARPILVIEGPIGSGRMTACAQAAGSELVVLDLSTIPPAGLADALVALRRESVLRSRVPVITNADHMLGEEQRDQRRLIGSLVDRIDGPLFITTSVAGIDLGTHRAIVRISWDVSDTPVRKELWARCVATIGATVDGDLTGLSHRYRVGPGAIERAVASVQLLHPPGTALGENDLVHGLRHNIAERLSGLAQRVEITQSWDDLVIADDIRDLIAALIGRMRHSHQVLDQWGYRRKIARGAGVPALFSGPPGTGKTMVAGLIARELDLELYQVDLSKVTSKWVGETEKNLGRVFDAAEEGHGLLLFDEADSLFGQRSSDVQGANDRYANLEVNYLLQRVEAFGGITILTTNLETAIDTALKRRLASHIVFAAPEDDERARLWERQTTTGTSPLDADVDHEELSRLFPKMSGANIRNAAISAAFLAAADGSLKINQAHLIRSARAEYRSMGHVISDASLGRFPGKAR
ncbi:hypothetical protein BH11MYX3_BH11MYX3_27450 [soil metagenome]